jgi:hypothetical protein
MKLWWIAAAMTFAACQLRAEPSGFAEGTIAIGPINAGPFRDATFVVRQEERTVVVFTTDEHGRFRVSLPPGQYSAELKDRKPGVGQYGPFLFDVRDGQTTKVEWQCDNSSAVRLGPTDR